MDLHCFDANPDPESKSDRHQHGYSVSDLHKRCHCPLRSLIAIEVGERYLFFAHEDWAI